MTISQRRLTEHRDEDDRSQEALDFIEAVTTLCREHGFSIGHEDSHGGFEVYRYTEPNKLEANLDWFQAATEVRWLEEAFAPQPEEPDPFASERPDPF